MSNALGPNGVTDVFEGGGGGGGEGPRGPRGYSAYEVAVQNGFVGTQAEWLESLEGADGAPGAPGDDGKSAYEVAVDEGFVGTEDEWLESLKGEKGDKGEPGDSTGIPGPKGDPGDPGADGDSAYQVAVNNGFVGSEVEWLASLEGSDGAPGTPGSPGSPGPAGDSAYQVALDNGFSGTEAQWLASLEGADGAPGADGDPGPEGASAYQVAVDNGFAGTPEQWLESLKGADGDPGPDGDSAYDVAVTNGFVGTESDWLASLQGEDGAPGAPGVDGDPGPEGDSAYEVAVSNGFVGTETQWLNSLKGADGTSAFLPATVNVPGDYATIQAALDAYDAAGGLVVGNAQFTIQLPSAGLSSPLTERFAWTDRNYARVKIKGATPITSMVTATSTMSGSTSIGYTLTCTVDAAVATAAAAAGYAMLESGIVLNHVDKFKSIGYWPVVSTTSTTVTIRIWSLVGMTGSHGDSSWRMTVFPTVFKVPALASGSPAWWLYANRTKCPFLEDFGVVGGAFDGGYTPADGHTAISLLDSELQTVWYDGQTSASRSCSLAVSAFYWGLALRHKAKFVGGISISSCASLGVFMANASEAVFMPLWVTGCGKNVTGGAVGMYGFSTANFGGGNFARPSHIAGNGGNGLIVGEQSMIYYPCGSISSNSATPDLLVQNNANAMLYDVSLLALGTVSPAVNTLGNNNSYIRR